MAEIFAASSEEHGALVVKALLPELCRDAEFVQMLADEAALTCRFEHPNLVRSFEFDEHNGQPFLVMERVDGCTLAELIDAGPLSPELALAIAARLADALRYVHQAKDEQGRLLNVVHRDLSPRNVLLSHRGDVKLGDFGIARSRMRSCRTRTGVIKGTVRYMSPEQVCGDELAPQSDVYGLGLLLFEMLGGQPFLQAEREVELLRLAENPVWHPVTELNPELPAGCDRLLQPALAAYAEQRYADAGAFLKAIERCAKDASLSLASTREIGDAVSRVVPPTVVAAEPPAPTPTSAGRALLFAALIAVFAGLGVLLWRSSDKGKPKKSLASQTVQRGDARPADKEPTPPSRDAGTKDQKAAAAKDVAVGDSRVAVRADKSTRQPSKLAKIKRRSALRRNGHRNGHRDGHRKTAAKRARPSDAGVKRAPPRDYSQQQKTLHKRLRSAMQALTARGILVQDLPRQLATNRKTLLSTLSKKGAIAEANENQLTRQVSELEKQLRALQVDRSFIQSKITRVHKRLQKVAESRRKALEQKAALALQDFMDGRYTSANSRLNQILAALR
jgi:serine/threonine protein kinase